MSWLHVVVDVPDGDLDGEADFWSQALGWELGPPWDGYPELRSFEPPSGEAYVHLQSIVGPTRIHVDLESDDPELLARQAVSLGATFVHRSDHWSTLHSPGGLPFCALQARPHTPPQPTHWPQGHRSRLVQVCIDSPRDRHEAEVAFWKALLHEGRWVDSPAEEFAGKWHDDAGSPVQLLFQALEEHDGTVRAHLDLGTDDQTTEVDRLLSMGALDVGRGHGGWHVLQDPAGLLFCVTENPPEQTLHRVLD